MLSQTKEKKRIIPKRLQLLIDGGENETLDFKKEITNTHKIAKTIVSFANHKGGILLVGVNDDKTISGIDAEEEKHILTTAADFFCKPSVPLEIKEHPLGKKTILEIVIPKGKEKPYFAKGDDEKWWAYIRVKDQSLLASKVVLDVLRRENNEEQTLIKYSSKEQALLDYLGKNERITLKEYCRLLNISRKRAQIILVNLISIGMIRAHTTEKADFYTLS
ncbi:MAG: ATP-binding protein [Bacteroidota bacterium]